MIESYPNLNRYSPQEYLTAALMVLFGSWLLLRQLWPDKRRVLAVLLAAGAGLVGLGYLWFVIGPPDWLRAEMMRRI